MRQWRSPSDKYCPSLWISQGKGAERARSVLRELRSYSGRVAHFPAPVVIVIGVLKLEESEK